MRNNLLETGDTRTSRVAPHFSHYVAKCRRLSFSLNPIKLLNSLKLVFIALTLLICQTVHSAEIVLIIDDMGNKSSDGKAFNLPPEVAFAILPHTPFSKSFAKRSENENRDVLIHMPMEALSGLYMGPGGISADMDNLVIKDLLAQAHSTIPNAIGINNHMGSRLTQLQKPMSATMEYLIYHRMFFVDSKTTRYSKAQKVAQDYGVPNLGRHVFLDHFRETKHIDYQFRRLVRRAKKYGFAVGIAHPHDVTLDYLVVALNALQQEGVTLSHISDKIQPQKKKWVWNQPGQLSR